MEILSGIVLQYVRSVKAFPEWGTVIVVIVMSAAAFLLSPEGAKFHPTELWGGLREFIGGMVQHATVIVAAQGGTSIAANLVAGDNPKLVGNLAIPVTDSI
jgi:hypothetical protein